MSHTKTINRDGLPAQTAFALGLQEDDASEGKQITGPVARCRVAIAIILLALVGALPTLGFTEKSSSPWQKYLRAKNPCSQSLRFNNLKRSTFGISTLDTGC